MQQAISRRFYKFAPYVKEVMSSLLIQHFAIAELELAHEAIDSQFFERGTDQASPFHKVLYSEFDKQSSSPLLDAYQSLAVEWLECLRCEHNINDWAIQRYPSIRVQLPNNVSVFEFHRDSDYNHPIGEINHFLSITRSERTAALHVEKTLGWKDYAPLELESCESAVLNTSIFQHGDVINNENYTRFSIDFRAIPLCLVDCSSSQKSITKGKVFSVNDYFISSQSLLRP